jgi:hypothetical protein
VGWWISCLLPRRRPTSTGTGRRTTTTTTTTGTGWRTTQRRPPTQHRQLPPRAPACGVGMGSNGGRDDGDDGDGEKITNGEGTTGRHGTNTTPRVTCHSKRDGEEGKWRRRGDRPRRYLSPGCCFFILFYFLWPRGHASPGPFLFSFFCFSGPTCDPSPSMPTNACL